MPAILSRMSTPLVLIAAMLLPHALTAQPPPRTDLAYGYVVWRGRLQKGDVVTVAANQASVGTISGALLPGKPVSFDAGGRFVEILDVPRPENGWAGFSFRVQRPANGIVKFRWEFTGVALTSPGSLASACKVLVSWMRVLNEEVPGVDFYHSALGPKVTEKTLNLFRDEYFVPLLGQPYDQITPNERLGYFGNVFLRCREQALSPEDSKTIRGMEVILSRAFTSKKGEAVIAGVAERENLVAWARQSTQALPQIQATPQGLDELEGYMRKGATDLEKLWPREKEAFLSAVIDHLTSLHANAAGNCAVMTSVDSTLLQAPDFPKARSQAIRLLEQAGQQGCAHAYALLGVAFTEAAGTNRDDAQAARWFSLASNQGDALATIWLAEFRIRGFGGPEISLRPGPFCSRRRRARSPKSPRERELCLASWTALSASVLNRSGVTLPRSWE